MGFRKPTSCPKTSHPQMLWSVGSLVKLEGKLHMARLWPGCRERAGTCVNERGARGRTDVLSQEHKPGRSEKGQKETCHQGVRLVLSRQVGPSHHPESWGHTAEDVLLWGPCWGSRQRWPVWEVDGSCEESGVLVEVLLPFSEPGPVRQYWSSLRGLWAVLGLGWVGCCDLKMRRCNEIIVLLFGNSKIIAFVYYYYVMILKGRWWENN